MAEAQDLACARCGAILPPSAARVATTCPFCGATAAPVPKIVERVVERIVVAAPPVADGGAFRCPRCAASLREVRENDTTLRGCQTCGGVWIDRESLARFGKNDREAEAMARRIIGPIAMGRLLGTAPDDRAEISCPTCGKPLRRVKIQFTDTSVDLCDEHGTWLDWGELSVFLRPPTEDPARELTPEELDAAGLSGRSNEEGGFFSNLKQLLFGSS